MHVFVCVSVLKNYIQNPVPDQQIASVEDDTVTVAKPNTLHLSVSVTSASQTLILPLRFGLQSGSYFDMAALAIIT